MNATKQANVKSGCHHVIDGVDGARLGMADAAMRIPASTRHDQPDRRGRSGIESPERWGEMGAAWGVRPPAIDRVQAEPDGPFRKPLKTEREVREGGSG